MGTVGTGLIVAPLFFRAVLFAETKHPLVLMVRPEGDQTAAEALVAMLLETGRAKNQRQAVSLANSAHFRKKD
jgi:hypothetical protein